MATFALGVSPWKSLVANKQKKWKSVDAMASYYSSEIFRVQAIVKVAAYMYMTIYIGVRIC